MTTRRWLKLIEGLLDWDRSLLRDLLDEAGRQLVITIQLPNSIVVKGFTEMTFPLNLPGPYSGNVAASTAGITISNLAATSSDATVFTVANDPSNPPGGLIFTPVGVGSATVSLTATGSDGSSLTGTATITVSAAVTPDTLVLTITGVTPTTP